MTCNARGSLGPLQQKEAGCVLELKEDMNVQTTCECSLWLLTETDEDKQWRAKARKP